MKKTLARSVVMAVAGALLVVGNAVALPNPITGSFSISEGWFQARKVSGSNATKSDLADATIIDFLSGAPANSTVPLNISLASVENGSSAVGNGKVYEATDVFASYLPDGTAITMRDFEFTPVQAPNPVALWSAGGFTFMLDSISVAEHTAKFLNLTGTGYILGNGYDATPGEWTFTATDDGKNTIKKIAWTATQTGAAPVPEPATMLLLGSGLVGLATVSRRRRRG